MKSTAISVLRADTKNILRDSSLVMMLIVPFIFIPLLRYGGGALVANFPEVTEYLPMAVILFIAMVAVFPAFVLGFVMMDEKDGGINQVLRVLPFDLNKLIALRVTTMFTVGTINALLLGLFNELVHFKTGYIVALSVNLALFAPITAFLMLCLSTNKIEAAALMKGISFVLPVTLLQFFIPNGYKYFLAPIPTFWACRAFESMQSMAHFMLFNSVGILLQFGYLLMLWKWFLKKW